MSYLKFTRERAGLSDQQALVTGLSKLTDRLDAVALGNAYRTYSHIRDVARRMLLSRNEPATEQVMASIVETLAERVYAHGHAIGLREAEQIGLPAQGADDDLDAAMWQLLNIYEADLRLLEPIDPVVATAASDFYSEPTVIAVVETTAGGHECAGEVQIKAKRQIPQNINVTVSLNLQTPQAGQTLQLTQALQQALVQQAQQAVQQALKDQAPIAGYEVGLRGARWEAYD